ncbi:hypothetical protein CF327_g7469, partial [Tilletia walkeri]
HNQYYHIEGKHDDKFDVLQAQLNCDEYSNELHHVQVYHQHDVFEAQLHDDNYNDDEQASDQHNHFQG